MVGMLLTGLVLLLLSSSALAATIVGTAKNDVIRGTSKADKLYGRGGNDTLYGMGGNDTLVGGPGADKLHCGAGRDVAIADAKDQVSADCETVRGPMLPSISIGDASVPEGNSGTTPLAFQVTLSRPVSWNVAVAYATADGTANAASDYAASQGKVTFSPGETTKTIDVQVNGDTVVEPDETLTISLSGAVNARIATNSATGTIKNDDRNAQPGHYKGMSSMLTDFEFYVTPDGAGVTGLITGQFNEDCTPGGGLYGGNLNLGSYTVPISADGRFTMDIHLNETVDGIPADNHLVITGKFTGTTAAGTLLSTTSFTDQGTAFSCSSNPQTWTAAKTG